MIPKPTHVESAGEFKIKLSYADGTTGIADLSHLVGKGVFSLWQKEGVFEKVYIDPETNSIAWNEEVDICPDTLFFKLKGITFNEWKKTQLSYADH